MYAKAYWIYHGSIIFNSCISLFTGARYDLLCNASFLLICASDHLGALIKPWLPQELKEKRNIDISASERLEMLKKFV
jgi:hypothetical protein